MRFKDKFLMNAPCSGGRKEISNSGVHIFLRNEATNTIKSPNFIMEINELLEVIGGSDVFATITIGYEGQRPSW